MSQSEIARIREQIALEYQSGTYAFSAFTVTGKHEFLTKRQENIASHFEELQKHLSPEEAMQILIEESTKNS